MTTALALDAAFSPHTDRGVSEDALTMRRRISELYDDMAVTQTVGQRLYEIYNALWENYNECSIENWDGYGAESVTEADLDAAFRFLRTLPTSIPSPEISVDPDGEFAFEWYRGNDLLSASIGRLGRISYAARFGHRKVHGTEYLGDEAPHVIITNLERLFS